MFKRDIYVLLDEAITNALKYAFPDRHEGLIIISMGKKTDGHIYLSISDNGVGLSEDLDHLNSNSLGMKLMAGLSQDIDADFSIESKDGTAINLVLRSEEADDTNDSESPV